MMWRFCKANRMRHFLSIGILFCVCMGCQPKTQKKHLVSHPDGYWWQILAFSSDSNLYQPGHIAWVNACFKTLHDSVFYDSEHDLRNRFFVPVDSSQKGNLLKQLISGCT